MKKLFSFFKRSDVRRKSTRLGASFRTPVDRWLLIGIIFLSLFGLLMVYDSSVAIAIRDFSDPYYFAYEQFKWILVGFVAMFIFSFIDYHYWYRLAAPMLMGTIGLLIAVFLPGIGINAYGAHRWINLGFTTLQPAEFAKLTLIIYLSAWFTTKEKERLKSFLILLGMVVGLVILEPDLGTSIVLISTSMLLYFFSGAPIKHFAMLVPAVIAGIVGLAITSPYRLARVVTFLNPDHDPKGASYHIRQATLALGSGGWLGVGIGKSRQKYEYLPEANTDSIFAIIGEEIGFIGATLFVVFILFIVWRGFRIAKRAPDAFGQLLALGITSWIAVQSLINIGAMVALVPLTGVPLPFVSYGGSSLIISLSAIGILLNISKQRRA